jgi:hypothetical protein
MILMKTVTIAEFKRDLPLLLEEVAKGGSIILQRGRKRQNVAVLGPFCEVPTPPRPLGLLAKRGKPVFKDWKIDESEFLSPR